MISRSLAFAFLLASCGGSSSPATEPAASAAPVATAEPAPAASSTLELVVEKDGVRLGLGSADKLVADADLAASIRGLDHDGTATIELADDATYDRLVTAMDMLGSEGIAPAFDLRDPPDDDPATRPVRDAKLGEADMKNVPVVFIKGQDVTYVRRGGSVDEPTTATASAGAEVPALAEAILGDDPPAATVVLQADRAVSGAVINRVMRTLIRTGLSNVLFAVKVK